MNKMEHFLLNQKRRKSVKLYRSKKSPQQSIRIFLKSPATSPSSQIYSSFRMVPIPKVENQLTYIPFKINVYFFNM